MDQPDAGPARYAVPNPRRSDAPRHLRTAVPGWRTDRRGADRAGGGFAAGGVQAPWVAEAGRTGARPARRPQHALQRATGSAFAARGLDAADDRLLGEPYRRPGGPAEEDGSVNNPADAET